MSPNQSSTPPPIAPWQAVARPTSYDGTADAGIGVLALGHTAGIILVTRKYTAEVTTVERPAFGLGVGPRGVAAHGAF